MSTPALRHFIERALGIHAPVLEDGFPPCFDWERLCSDAPEMVVRLGGGSDDGSERTWSAALQGWAQETFRSAHIAGLAVLSAAAADDDPEAILDRFSEEPEDDEEDRFETLVHEVLAPVEASLGGDEVALDERGHLAQGFFDEAWAQIEPVLAEIEGRVLEDEDVAGEETLTVLLALARVACLLAVLRWMAAFPDPD
jgi:hypothetical protein